MNIEHLILNEEFVPAFAKATEDKLFDVERSMLDAQKTEYARLKHEKYLLGK